MPDLETPSGPLHYEMCNLVAPWVAQPETIVFHHGVAANLGLWSHWLPHLAANYVLLRLDMRGFGKSAPAATDSVWSFERLTADLDAVVEHAGLERFHLVGESLGGTVCLAYALGARARVQSLTLSNTAARGGHIANVGSWRELIAEQGQHAWAQKMMQWRFHEDALDSATYAWFLDVHERCDTNATLALAELLLGVDLLPQLSDLDIPTLLLSPDESPFIQPSLMAEMHHVMPNSRLQVFAHSKHGLPLSHGSECARLLYDFLGTLEEKEAR